MPRFSLHFVPVYGTKLGGQLVFSVWVGSAKTENEELKSDEEKMNFDILICLNLMQNSMSFEVLNDNNCLEFYNFSFF